MTQISINVSFLNSGPFFSSFLSYFFSSTISLTKSMTSELDLGVVDMHTSFQENSFSIGTYESPSKKEEPVSTKKKLDRTALMSESRAGSSSPSSKDDDMELRRGPWTLEEDTLLIHYIACHGEGRWNLLARCSGLKRTGKSCRLRWLNYLKPDIKRGNLTPEEQLLILELHSKWGNRWSRIAQHLPGRTDNEIKNYWRTRVQKQARQLKVDANSSMFRDAVRCYWMPRLLEKMDSSPAAQSDAYSDAKMTTTTTHASPSPATAAHRGQELFDNDASSAHQYCQLETTTSGGSYYEPPGPPPPPPETISPRGEGVTLNPLLVPGGQSPMNAYDDDLSAWEYSALMSASAPSCCYSTSDYNYTDAPDHNYCSSSSGGSINIGDSLWSMDELRDMLKSYMSGAESNVPFDD